MKSTFIFFITILVTLTACQASGNAGGAPATASAAALDNQELVATMVSQTLTAIKPTSTPTQMIPTVTASPFATPGMEWVGQKIELYRVTIHLPRDWQIHEVNRRPEPTDPTSNEIIGHDCADYEITIPGELAILKVESACGYSEAFWDPLPQESFIINPKAADRITRYPSGENIYRYSHVCSYPDFRNNEPGICTALFRFGDGSMWIHLKFTRPVDPDNEVFKVADQVVLFLTK